MRQEVDNDDKQFGFMWWCGTRNLIFILRQLKVKYLAKKRNLYFAFVDLEKAFDWVPGDVVWWALRKLGVKEWLAKIIQLMRRNARNCVRVNGTFSDDFLIQVGLHQDSKYIFIKFL